MQRALEVGHGYMPSAPATDKLVGCLLAISRSWSFRCPTPGNSVLTCSFVDVVFQANYNVKLVQQSNHWHQAAFSFLINAFSTELSGAKSLYIFLDDEVRE